MTLHARLKLFHALLELAVLFVAFTQGLLNVVERFGSLSIFWRSLAFWGLRFSSFGFWCCLRLAFCFAPGLWFDRFIVRAVIGADCWFGHILGFGIAGFQALTLLSTPGSRAHLHDTLWRYHFLMEPLRDGNFVVVTKWNSLHACHCLPNRSSQLRITNAKV